MTDTARVLLALMLLILWYLYTEAKRWRFKEYAHIPHLTPSLVLGHMLRHTCGFSLANQGYDLRLIQDYPGHHDSQHTVQHYTRVAGVRFGGSGGGR